MKTSELTGKLLDRWVAEAEKLELSPEGMRWDQDIGMWRGWNPSTDWRDGGPLIEREKMLIGYCGDDSYWPGKWFAEYDYRSKNCHQVGDSPLIAAMRAYVASKFGDDVPEVVAQ